MELEVFPHSHYSRLCILIFIIFAIKLRSLNIVELSLQLIHLKPYSMMSNRGKNGLPS
jgi:hypothetical protein